MINGRIDYEALSQADVAAAVRVGGARPRRSDFDLNPGARADAPTGRDLRPAAVLCPLIERPAGLHVILTRRADHLSKHAGQIAFPGGKIDPGDPTPLAAALREAHEEIGLAPSAVDVVGPIDRYETGTGFAITPFIGFVAADFTPTPDVNEVAEVFETPLAFLMDPRNHKHHVGDWGGRRRRYYAMPYGDRYIWGATAGMLKCLSERLALTAPIDAAS